MIANYISMVALVCGMGAKEPSNPVEAKCYKEVVSCYLDAKKSESDEDKAFMGCFKKQKAKNQ